MYKHSPERALKFAGRSASPDHAIYLVAALAGALLLTAEWQAAAQNQSGIRTVQWKLAQTASEFDNHDAPLIPTLLQLAATYSLPMGIEKVTPRAMRQPIRIRVNGGNVASLLTLAVHRVPGYAWAVEDGTVDIFGEEERSDPSNLLSFVLPSFEVHDQTLNTASMDLRTKLVLEVLKPPGIYGDYIGNSELEKKRMSFALRKPTARQVLNYMVALYGGAVWLARVRPNCLRRLPDAGLWLVLPHSVEDPGYLVDLSPCDSQ